MSAPDGTAPSAMTGQAKISIRNLNVFYGDQPAIQDLTLDLAAGKATAVIGPSGCGKSTLLRVLNRLCDEVTGQTVTGVVQLDGVDIFSPLIDLMVLRGRVGMIFQDSTVFPMSVFNNVAFSLRLRDGLTTAAVASGVEHALRRAALWDEVKDRLATPADGLSGGQQQRLCIARALATDPEVLLCDEPTSALDPASMERIEQLILDLKPTVTIVLVTHNMHQARRVADDVAFLFLGKLVEFGRTAQMFETPKAKLLADYLSGEFG